MSDLNEQQRIALGDAYTTLRAAFNVYKHTEHSMLTTMVAESMSHLTSAFPEIAELEENLPESA